MNWEQRGDMDMICTGVHSRMYGGGFMKRETTLTTSTTKGNFRKGDSIMFCLRNHIYVLLPHHMFFLSTNT